MALNVVSNTTNGSYIQTENGKIVPTNRRNYLINGNFGMWQRGTSLVGGLQVFNFIADRWFEFHDGTSATTTTSQQLHTIGESLSSSKYFIRSVIIGGTGVTAESLLIQRIEGVRTAAGKTITLSFLAKADTNKKLSVIFGQWFGTGGSPSATVNTLGATLNITNAWARYTVTVTLPSISGKTIGTNNDDILQVALGMSDPNNAVGQQSGTFDISDVKLEDGSVATDGWHPYDGEFGGEVQACSRYLPVADVYSSGQCYATTLAVVPFKFKTDARVAPTGITATGTHNLTSTGGGSVAVTVSAVSSVSTSSATINFTTASGLVAGQATVYLGGSGKIIFTGCEL